MIASLIEVHSVSLQNFCEVELFHSRATSAFSSVISLAGYEATSPSYDTGSETSDEDSDSDCAML